MGIKDIVKSSGSRVGGFKIGVLAVLILLFLIPLSMVQSIIYERRSRAQFAEAEIMESWGGEFLVLGPVLQIPGKTYTQVRSRNESGVEITETRESDFSLRVVPEELNVEIDLGTETRRRGIFSVPLFSGTVNFSGQFDLDRVVRELRDNQEIFTEDAELLFTLASQRGIRGINSAEWNNGTIDFLSGNPGTVSLHGGSRGGIYGPVHAIQDGINNFNISISVQGGRSIRMVPLGEETSVMLQADWPSPSFQGSYLPLSRNIDSDGFSAHWQISHLSRNIPPYWNDSQRIELGSEMFGVNFFEALDHYAMNIRAAKYGILFIIIPFLSLFIFEMILRRNIHIIQYILSGIGNVTFYLLLLSISEHISFPAAYVISALSVAVMMTLYSSSLLGSWRKAPVMTLIMVLCYAYLYFTLQSEDMALLIGSIGVFAITGVVMFVTRNIKGEEKAAAKELQ